MALEMYAHHQVPVVFVQADEHAVAQHSGVVDQHMHFAERRERGVDDALGTGQAGNVVTVGNGLATTGADLAGHRLRRLGTDIVDHHLGALGAECQRISAAQSAACTGDDHRAAFTYRHV
ncbi:hypothetical protein D3C81_373060 [compost metagenome]